MNSLIIMFIGLAFIAAGYFLYSKYLSEKVYKLNPRAITPAHAQKDGVDFVPTNKWVLWGHHFTSVAGAAPITGPAIAMIWGWLPAFLWVTIGTVFFAGMHDFGALWAATRNKGHTIGDLAKRYIGSRGSLLFTIVIFLLIVIVNAVFASIIAGLLVSTPTSVIPTWGAIVVALLIGQAIYRFKWNLPLVSIVGVIVLYGLMILGDMYPIVLPETILGMSAQSFWIVVLFIYAGIASLMPVWMLLQPRDYINGLQLFVGLGILYLAIIISAPTVLLDPIATEVPAGTPPIWPLLFVTVACGAISGFHGVVASGTSSKQLNKETDARLVGYFGAVGEGLLALGTIVAVSAGFNTVTEFQDAYAQGGIGAFVAGGGNILNAGLGIPFSLSATILATMAVLFAATTMDTAVRLHRLVIVELGARMGVKISPLVGTIIAVGLGLGLAFGVGENGSGGMVLWPLFGTTNQILAVLTLAVLAVILMRKRRPVLPILIPLLFVFAMTFWALVLQLITFVKDGDWLLLVLGGAVFVAALWTVIESVTSMRRAVTEAPEPADADGVEEWPEQVEAGSSQSGTAN
ncbi:carbon starvation CstA family protein [Gulosibacter hominis]|uniref:carbon starvation CstA family protein n=1 Tax=Gulosibacter hominis TaxID=2770504 RepID=UPI00191B7B85|nr:carbon starvation protein A [Gulosibacter hominis]